MEILKILRAKSKDEKNYLLKDHISETIKQAIQLIEFIKTNKNSIKYIELTKDDFFEDLIKASFLHDLGKISLSFQKEVFKKERKREDWKKIEEFFEDVKDVEIKDHEILSVIYSLIFLDNNENEQKIRTAILLHHYNNFYVNREKNIRYIFDDYPDLEKYLNFLCKNEEKIKKLLDIFVQEVTKEVQSNKIAIDTLEELKNNINFEQLNKLKSAVKKRHGLSTQLKLYEINNENPDYNFFIFLGCLRRCDYAASGSVNIERTKNISDIFINLENEIRKAVKILTEKEDLWQEEILRRISRENVVLVAPTGSGKTEFALLWAKRNNRKLIYTLPLRVALNDLFNRFREYEITDGTKEKIYYFDRNFVDILHSTSFIEYLKEGKEGENIKIDDKMSSTRLFSSPILLTTPDQVFLSSLKFYGFDKLISLYSLSSIVIDEIQAYNPEMAAVIIKTLEIIKELQGNVLVITATFPPYFREFISNNKGFEILDIEKLKKEIKSEIKNYDLKRHKIELKEGTLFEYSRENNKSELKIVSNSLNELKEIIQNNKDKNIMLIVNNVGKAMKLYKILKKEELDKEEKKIKKILEKFDISDYQIELLHSRLIEKVKSERIARVKENLKNKVKTILVATQIVEASVDVDFDILITEISPIDSQIQRWGRVFRNRKENYDKDKSNIFIFTEIDRGISAIYQPKEVMKKTIEVLKGNENKVFDYEEERKLIEEVFNKEVNGKKLKEIYVDEINKNLEWLKYYSAEKRSEAQRIFRRIAGIQVVIPDLMFKSGDEIDKAFGEVIKDKINWNLPWEGNIEESIVEKVKEKINDNLKNNVSKWKLLEILYFYSFNLPIFTYEKHTFTLIERENFKGFFVLRINDEETLTEIEKYGINNLKGINIDEEEIKESTNNII